MSFSVLDLRRKCSQRLSGMEIRQTSGTHWSRKDPELENKARGYLESDFPLLICFSWRGRNPKPLTTCDPCPFLVTALHCAFLPELSKPRLRGLCLEPLTSQHLPASETVHLLVLLSRIFSPITASVPSGRHTLTTLCSLSVSLRILSTASPHTPLSSSKIV